MNEKNHTMGMLTGIAIILVVLGHLDWDVLSFGGLFPYYSFHVMIFVFISGYFYREKDESHIGAYIIRKARHLLLPYFIWNLIYGIISTILSAQGFVYCSRISLFNFFIEPFLGGHQYGLNFASWFVPALFMVQIVNIIMRKVCFFLHKGKEWIIFAACLLVGIAVVYLAQTGHVWGYYKTPGRILFMLPVFQMGRIYRLYLEKKDTLSSYIYFPILTALQLAVILFTEGQVNFSAVWCTSFASLPFVPYLTTMTGIAFWLRISRELTEHGLCSLVEKAGDSSFDIMMNHVSWFFCINLIIRAICDQTGAAIPFDSISFMENANYAYMPGGIAAFKIVYLAAGLVMPILAEKVYKTAYQRISLTICRSMRRE